jgi:hypothetical protein
MKLQVLIISALFSLLSGLAYGQETDTVAVSKTTEEKLPPQQKLKDGVLLVRLRTQKNKIKALQDAGRSEEAQDVINTQKIENDLIMAAFDQTYTYSKVYFFYSTDGQKILDKQWDGVLMNAQQMPVEVSSDQYFLIAAFGESEGRKIDGLIIYDQEAHQMKRPFPYLTRRKHFFNILSRSHGDMIKLFKESL